MDRMQMSMTIPGQPQIEIDTDDDSASGLGQLIANIVKPMIGKDIKVVMDERGKIVDFKMPAGALKGLESNPMLQGFLSEETLKQMTTNGSPVFPKRPSTRGINGRNEFTVDTPIGDMTTKAEYEYQGEGSKDGKSLDKIGVKMTMEFGKSKNPALGQIEIVNQNNTGTTWFDADSATSPEPT